MRIINAYKPFIPKIDQGLIAAQHFIHELKLVFVFEENYHEFSKNRGGTLKIGFLLMGNPIKYSCSLNALISNEI